MNSYDQEIEKLFNQITVRISDREIFAITLEGFKLAMEKMAIIANADGKLEVLKDLKQDFKQIITNA
jgi:DNA polymerase III sliding clamp (beta) subunit (PCNA family)